MRDSADSDDYGVTRRGSKRGKFRYDEPTYEKRDRHRPRLAAEDAHDAIDGLPEGDRWSTWDQSIADRARAPPHPKWLVTDLAAVDTELGVLKTGKEADVFLVRRGVAGRTGPACSPPSATGTPSTGMFHRDAATWKAAGSARVRVNRAVASRSDFGGRRSPGSGRSPSSARCPGCTRRGPRALPGADPGDRAAAGVHRRGRRDRRAPRLAETRPDPAELAGLWDQLVQAMVDAGPGRPRARRPVRRTTCSSTTGGW